MCQLHLDEELATKTRHRAASEKVNPKEGRTMMVVIHDMGIAVEVEDSHQTASGQRVIGSEQRLLRGSCAIYPQLIGTGLFSDTRFEAPLGTGGVRKCSQELEKRLLDVATSCSSEVGRRCDGSKRILSQRIYKRRHTVERALKYHSAHRWVPLSLSQ
jgi:hypothetical protein